MPALPLDEAGKYVAAAYLVFLALILIYVAIMAVRLSNLERDVRELAELAERELADEPDREAVRSRSSAETVTSLQGEAR
jgi:hypothetical protein